MLKKRRKDFLLLLHPDKRSEVDEARAGGKKACEDALQKVQDVADSLVAKLQNGWSPNKFATRPPAANVPRRTPPPPPIGSDNPRTLAGGLFVERDGFFIPVVNRTPPAKHFQFRRIYDVD